MPTTSAPSPAAHTRAAHLQPVQAGPAPRAQRLLWATAAALALGFVLLALEYPLALRQGRPPWTARLLATLSSAEFAFGDRSTLVYMTAAYRQALGALSAHMLLGALALGSGLLQLVPALRRRWPLVHRISGALVIAATVASMGSAIAFLLGLPGLQGSSGPVFHLGLWALALLTLGLLALALLALRARDYRSHMVWMVMVFAALATAPMLRLGWLALGRFSPLDQESANLGAGMLVLLATVLLMTLWLARVGDHDLPARPADGPLRPGALRLLQALAAASAGVALHEGLMAPLGLDLWPLLGAARDAGERLPPVAALWALATAALMAGLPGAFARAWRGERATGWVQAAGLGVALGAVLIGLQQGGTSLAQRGSQVFWPGLGLMFGALVLLSRRSAPSRGGRHPLTLAWLCWSLMPALLPGWIVLALLLGTRADEALAAALVNGIGGLAVAGAALGYGARLRAPPKA